jgi:ferredoxin
MKGICILGGGSNLKVTEDLLICEAAVKLSSENMMCLTYGNAAVTLGKYGYLDKEQGALAYCAGSEADIVKILELVQKIGGEKVIALYPELTNGRDLLAALALADAGVQVFTAVKLPVDGSEEAAKEITAFITMWNYPNLRKKPCLSSSVVRVALATRKEGFIDANRWQKCVGCGHCRPFCTMSSIHFTRSGKGTKVHCTVDEDECVDCGICYRSRFAPLMPYISRFTVGRVLSGVLSATLWQNTKRPGFRAGVRKR